MNDISNNVQGLPTNFQQITININNTESSYVDCSHIKNLKHFSIAHQNIRSIDKNSNNFLYLLNELNSNIDIICFTEVWGNINNLIIPGYHEPATLLRKNKRGGGVSIYCKDYINFKVIKEMTVIKGHIEFLTIEYKTKNKTNILSTLYRPPSQCTHDIENCIKDIKLLLEYKDTHFPNTNYDILGDLNMDILKYNTMESIRKFYQTFENQNIIPLINRPTRVTNNTASIIDNILSNNYNNSKNYIICNSITDHFLIIKSIQKTDITYKNTTNTYHRRKFNTDNINHFSNKLINEDWSHILNTNNTIDKWNKFFNKIDNIFNESFPNKKYTLKKDKKKDTNASPWIDDEIKKLFKIERKLYLKKLKSKLPLHNTQHVEFKKELQSKIRKAKIKYYENEFKKTKHDSKAMWRSINKATNRHTNNKKNTKPDKIIINNKELTEDIDIATELNKFFNGIGTELSNKIHTDNTKQQEYINNIHEQNTRFKFKNITADDITKINKTLKPKLSAGPDGIPSVIIKTILQKIPRVLANIINSSLHSGIVHNRLKAAIIVAIYKKGSKTDPNNYRPIALINAISKVLEKVVAHQLRMYLEKNNILACKQFGFRSLHSCIHAMIATMEKIEKDKDNKMSTSSIFIDLTKAFDTVDINILLTKLKKIGIQNTELNWFKNYLNGRTHTCKIGEKFSNFLASKIGVPQGSILGPLLFIIYINDLPDMIKCFINLFADDTMIAVSGKNKTEIETLGNTIMAEITEWFNHNKLTLNPTKTRIINFNTKQEINIKINDTIIQTVKSNHINTQESSFKFLGFLLDEKANFNSHINKTISKLNTCNHILRNIKKEIPTKQKILCYNALGKPFIEYGISIWAPNNTKALNTITTIQKRIILNIHGSSRRIHTEPLFKKYKILKFKDLITYNNLLIGHSVFYEYAPTAILNLIKKEVPHERLRRNIWNLKINGANKSSITKFTIPKDWNELNIELKQIKNRKKF